jgi:anti-sigma28 factor (negative regulator of flagellin synthesis)
MISQLNSAALRSAYAGNLGEAKESVQKSGTNISKQGDMSKVEQIKESLQSGEYKIDLKALSEKIADTLL